MPFFDQYPYTNFHNVNLDWVLERVKEWGQMVEDNNTRFENLQEANENFKEYVTNYIENLDYQAAVDDKLDRMFESGVLGEYLQPYVSPAVTTWLEENITEPVGVVIDSSLTVAGAAADAKATGTAIQNLALSNIARDALLECFQKVGWIDGTSNESYNKLQRALYNWGDDLLYKLVNVPVTFNGSTTISSGFSLWLEDYSFTIFLEYIDNTNHYTDTENKMIFRQARTSPWGALYLQVYNGGSIDATNASVVVALNFNSGNGDRVTATWRYSENKNNISHLINRFIISYDSVNNRIKIGFSHNGTILQLYSSSGDFDNFGYYPFLADRPLILGSNDNIERFFNGVINDFEIFKEFVTDEKMNNYLQGVVE